MKKGIKSSEFYVVVILTGAWAIRYLGLDVYFTPDNVDAVAEALKQAHAQTGADPAGYAGLIYVVGRVLLKWQAQPQNITEGQP